ncbi:MAG: RnfABCDGE type electron transport complex subunit B [Oscillospiraceae bacterium]|nr:RnfABCDGE type electron transport complex subunit B [Oscillospiraceae bacterium]
MTIIMNTIAMAITTVTALGLLCSVMLAVASKLMSVKVDEKVELVREALPGANCGACGFSGCDGYAAELAAGDAKTNLCTPGGDAVSRKISSILSVDFEDVIEQIAVVHCTGDDAARHLKMEYDGIGTCVAAKQLYGGRNACVYGCLGFGDCAAACPNGAICIENGLAHVDTRKCTGCGLCAKSCPNNVIFMEDDTITTVVLCRNVEKGAIVRGKCSHGCIGCGICARECPAGAIVVADNLARIEYEKCESCGKCVEACVTKCVRQANFSGIFKA